MITLKLESPWEEVKKKLIEVYVSTNFILLIFFLLSKLTTMNNTSTNCVDACMACLIACENCINDCINNNNKFCIILCRDCADICALCARLEMRHSVVRHTVLALCAKICNDCAIECAKHAAHQASCKTCEEACKKCEEACKEIAIIAV